VTNNNHRRDASSSSSNDDDGAMHRGKNKKRDKKKKEGTFVCLAFVFISDWPLVMLFIAIVDSHLINLCFRK
jgi:hypothetical protein